MTKRKMTRRERYRVEWFKMILNETATNQYDVRWCALVEF